MKKILNQALDLVLTFIFLALAVLIAFGVITNRITSDEVVTTIVFLMGSMGVHELSRIRRALEQLNKTAG